MNYLLLALVGVLVLWPRGSAANLNLFLTQSEVKRLLGLENELYYVRDGTINQYAIGFVIPIPSWIDKLHFSWFLNSPLLPLNYKLNMGSSNPEVIASPTVNISNSGSIPNIPQIWSVDVGCSGKKAGDVVINIDLILNQMDINKLTNTTLLSFKRKKVCHTFKVKTVAEKPTKKIPAYVIFFSAVGGCFIFLVLLFVTVISMWLQKDTGKTTNVAAIGLNNLTTQTSVSQSILNRSGGSHASQGISHNSGERYIDEVEPILEQTTALLDVDHKGQIILTNPQALPLQNSPRPVPYGIESTLSSFKQAPLPRPDDFFTSDVDSRYPDSKSKISSRPLVPIEEIAVDRLSLTLGDLLQEGTFGRIYQGRLDIDCDSEDVMVKTVVMGSSSQQTNKLVEEGSSLYSINHKHILSLIATTYDGSSPMMIYSYAYPGNLKKWLVSSHQSISTHQAVNMGLQLLTALKHLHKRHIIHKDVAARNCFLPSPVTIKLCDSALSRDLFPNDYHCLGDNENRPVKWMAVECISGGEFTAASDVWSWAVTIWEILTRSQQPFPDVDPFEMENYLMEGFRLHQPLNCPDQLYTVMASCWAHSAGHRTSVPNLYAHLSKFSSQLQEFV